MKTKFFFNGFSIAKALELQERARTKEEATAAYNGSCDRCTRPCKGEKCRVHQAYLLKMDMLDGQENKATVEYVATRDYNITSARALKKATLKKLKAIINNGNRSDFVVVAYKYITERNYGLLENLYKQTVKRGRVAESDINRDVYPLIKKLLEEV